MPVIAARRALAALPAGETVVVLVTDPEAPIDLAALAADEGHELSLQDDADGWRIALTKRRS